MKLRLLITEKCNRHCRWCANQYWDLGSLSVEAQFYQYSEILLTGGEPMLCPDYLIQISKNIRKQSKAKIYFYTAKLDSPLDILAVLHFVDGMSATPHNPRDIADFKKLNDLLVGTNLRKSLKLNNFTGYNHDLSGIDLSVWRVKNKVWLKKKHLPTNEVFKRA